jgi:hypothetical protein
MPQCRGLYFGPKTIFITPPPSENAIFTPSSDTSFFDSHCGLFALILPYFAFILPFSSPFLIFFPLSSFSFYIFQYIDPCLNGYIIFLSNILSQKNNFVNTAGTGIYWRTIITFYNLAYIHSLASFLRRATHFTSRVPVIMNRKFV